MYSEVKWFSISKQVNFLFSVIYFFENIMHEQMAYMFERYNHMIK